MSAMSAFLDECKDEGVTGVDEKADQDDVVESTNGSSASAGGAMLMTGCHDFQHATAKDAQGLATPYLVAPVSFGCVASYSGHSSPFMFFTTIEQFKLK